MRYLLAVLSAVLLILRFPGFDLVWLAPVALAPLLVAAAREPRPRIALLAGIRRRHRLLVRRVLLDPVDARALRRRRRRSDWALFLLFCLAKALHMGVFALLAGIGYADGLGDSRRRGIVGRDRSDARLAGIRVARIWATRASTWAIPMRLAPFTGVYGLSFVFAMLSAALALAVLRRPRRQLAWLAALPLLILLPRLPDFQPRPAGGGPGAAEYFRHRAVDAANSAHDGTWAGVSFAADGDG